MYTYIHIYIIDTHAHTYISYTHVYTHIIYMYPEIMHTDAHTNQIHTLYTYMYTQTKNNKEDSQDAPGRDRIYTGACWQ